ncbi:MAG: hypothetical protein KDC59_14240 [Saprospiraceae bacterium]|nr:hypothetical protein [Saprospiraceae bacterium]
MIQPKTEAELNSIQTLPGYHVYLFRQWRLTSRMGIQVEAGWTQRIYRYPDDVYFNLDRQQDVKVNRYLHHLTIPLTIAFQSKSFCWRIGAYKEWPLSSESDPKLISNQPNLPEDQDYGVVASGEWQLGPVGFFARCMFGMTRHLVIPFSDETGGASNTLQPRYSTLQAGIRCAVF